MKFFKLPLLLIRVFSICLIIIVTVILTSHQSGLYKLVKKMTNPSTLKTGQEWFLELEKTFTLCGHTEPTRNIYFSKELLTKAVQENPAYRLRRDQGQLWIYEMAVNDYCSSCRNNQFLGIRDDQAAIIRGTPEKPGPVQEKTSIRVDDLPKLESEDLKRGIPFNNEKEKLQLIEGLNGLILN